MGAAEVYRDLKNRNEEEWSSYKWNLEKDIFFLKWSHSRELTDIPRLVRTEGLPAYKISGRATRGNLRSYPAIKTPFTPQTPSDPSAPSTAYRLPKLPPDRASRSKIQRDYVFKEPVTESQFLIKKDPRNKSPAALPMSPELRIKPRSTKCRPPPITADAATRYLHKALKLNKSRHLQTQGFPGIAPSVSAAIRQSNPTTTPQSVEVNILPRIHVQRDSESPEPPKLKLEDVSFDPPSSQPSDRESSAWERHLTWQLSPFTNKNFDKQGLGPNTGPFSRELTRKCMPPTNWLRMKLRQRLREQLTY